jgi:hypothetical protein
VAEIGRRAAERGGWVFVEDLLFESVDRADVGPRQPVGRLGRHAAREMAGGQFVGPVGQFVPQVPVDSRSAHEDPHEVTKAVDSPHRVPP